MTGMIRATRQQLIEAKAGLWTGREITAFCRRFGGDPATLRAELAKANRLAPGDPIDLEQERLRRRGDKSGVS